MQSFFFDYEMWYITSKQKTATRSATPHLYTRTYWWRQLCKCRTSLSFLTAVTDILHHHEHFFICVLDFKIIVLETLPRSLDSTAHNIFRDAAPIKNLLRTRRNYHTCEKRKVVRKIKNELQNRNNNCVQLFRDSKRPSIFRRLLRPRAKLVSWRSRSISTSRFQA